MKSAFETLIGKTARTALILSGLLLPSLAQAADGKSYPGVLCNTSGATVIRDHGAIFNPSTTAHVFADCPIIQDGNGGLNNAQVAARDQNPDSIDPTVRHLNQVYCALFATKYFDAPAMPGTFFFKEASTVSRGPAFRTLILLGGEMPPASSVDIACRIPPASSFGTSGIGQYFSEEPTF